MVYGLGFRVWGLGFRLEGREQLFAVLCCFRLEYFRFVAEVHLLVVLILENAYEGLGFRI